ncbi:Hpt domain-containing protein [Pontibacterium granulatum]|uniref:Hpt domain-containing protein n=1 Tax=Pontibacterium granulatum TaxID=2036029 RepID=UPI002499B82F|nr:Hpt domain-containing protein [Pontibacterium granulatum]MDI3325523.1 Hpt domain-containing protein [Pontibacterium granulatum]
MSIDTSEFLDVLTEDSIEALSNIEASLLEIGNGNDSAELINTIFRDAHSIKGGCGMLGLEEIAGFAHLVEALLDQVREGERALNMPLVGLMLECVSALRGMFDVLKDGRDNDATLIAALKERLLATLENREAIVTASKSPVREVLGVPGPAAGLPLAERPKVAAEGADLLLGDLVRGSELVDQVESVVTELLFPSGDCEMSGWAVQFVPDHDLFLSDYDPLRCVAQLAELGDVEVTCDVNVMPEIARINPELCYLAWDIKVVTDAGIDAVRAIFAPVVNQCELIVEPLQEAHAKQLRAIIAEQEASRKDKPGQDALTFLRETVVGEFNQVDAQVAESAKEQSFSEGARFTGPSQAEGATVLEVGGGGSRGRGMDLEMASQPEKSEIQKNVDSEKDCPDNHSTVDLGADSSGAENVGIEPEMQTERTLSSLGMPSTTSIAPVMPVGEAEHKEDNVSSEGRDTAVASYAVSVCNQKIDTLINMAGELIFVQARLAKLSEKLERSGLQEIKHLSDGLARLESNASELQGEVVSVLKK